MSQPGASEKASPSAHVMDYVGCRCEITGGAGEEQPVNATGLWMAHEDKKVGLASQLMCTVQLPWRRLCSAAAPFAPQQRPLRAGLFLCSRYRPAYV